MLALLIGVGEDLCGAMAEARFGDSDSSRFSSDTPTHSFVFPCFDLGLIPRTLILYGR